MLDVDGVLVTRPAGSGDWAATISADLGIDRAALAREFFDRHWDSIVTGRSGLVEGLSACLPHLAPSTDPQEVIEYWFARDAHVDRDVLADVDAVRRDGGQVYLATNQEHLRADYLMRDMGLGDHVDGILYSAALGVRKPDPGFYAGCERATGRLPSDLTLIDDTPANVAAARHRGWAAHHWTGGKSLSALLNA